MKKQLLLTLLLLISIFGNAQTLKLKKRSTDALGGKAFALSISDSTLSLQDREQKIYREIKKGNVPDFLRKLVEISDTSLDLQVSYYVLADYLSIGSDDDFFYVPMTPILAQKVANLTKCSLPTKKIVDNIYSQAKIKLSPQPIPPTKAMTTVPVFIAHTDSVLAQLTSILATRHLGELVAGNKKDVIISNKIYGEISPRVVIYGWHKLDGKVIQPVYNKHTNSWADYSHGIRLVQKTIYVNQKKTSLEKALRNAKFNLIFSDEGSIEKSFYPVFENY
ncbi:hypothetical protein DU508_01115 [Pedobacter chinensis]|uniref:Uncharacterized protein n=1 Tax=Pedobacter chinensis TaxID=2282421 RepID=A0A369Q6A2_9SPHI|nr:hypothetical protein [Pedobacter chinensis]RDC58626.1 hypothetical protein DU508_01115 [Pedobacter chinensis]